MLLGRSLRRAVGHTAAANRYGKMRCTVTAERTSMAISPIVDIIAEIRAGRMVVLVDEEDRENEGDLVLAADCVNADAINFMARFGRGLVCMPITDERARDIPKRVAIWHDLPDIRQRPCCARS